MTDLPAEAKATCEHFWASHIYDGLSVRLCQFCHEPDWQDVRSQLAEAAAAERERLTGPGMVTVSQRDLRLVLGYVNCSPLPVSAVNLLAALQAAEAR